MTNPGQVSLKFHNHTFFELSATEHTIFIDPVFSHERRGRRVADEVRSCDYVFATSATPWFEDVLDVLDGCEATFVGTPQLTRQVRDQLGLKKSRLLDLEPWERASDQGLRITAFPISASLGMEGTIEEGMSIMQDMSNVFPGGAYRIPLFGQAMPLLNSGLQNVTRLIGNAGSLQPRSLGRVGDMLGMDVGRLAGGRPGLGYLFEIEGHPSLLHLGDGVHGGTQDEDLEEIAEVCEPDVLVLHADGMSLEPVVRTVRILNPKTVLLYRARDPYAAGRRGQTLPISSFIGAIEEGTSGCEALHMAKGDTYILDKKAATPAASRPFVPTPPTNPTKPLSTPPKA